MAAEDFPHVEGVEHRFVEAGGLRVHVAEAGAGNPLVLLHGWPQHWYAWRHLIAPLAERYRVICPDLRGHGWTDAPPDGYEKESLASDLLNLLDALELERVRLVGHDWGGFAGFLACLRRPERFERYVAINIIHPWYRPPPVRPQTLKRISYQLLLVAPVLGSRAIRAGGVIRQVFERGSVNHDAWSPDDVEAFVERFRDPARARATQALYRAFLLREAGALRKGRYDDQRLTVPTLLLVGEGDRVVRIDGLGGYESHADDMRIEGVPDCGHFPAEERPRLVLERVLDFFGG